MPDDSDELQYPENKLGQCGENSMLSRRTLLQSAGVLPLVMAGAGARADAAPAALKSMTLQAKPIAPEERRARIAKVQSLMAQQKIAALLIESGSSLGIFHRHPLASIGAHDAGDHSGSRRDLRGDSGFRGAIGARDIASGRRCQALGRTREPVRKNRAEASKTEASISGVLAAESTMRFFIIAGIRQASQCVRDHSRRSRSCAHAG